MSIFTRGGSQTTVEKIDWRSTLRGILAFALLMAGCRMLAFLLLSAAALAIGRAAGLIFLAMAVLLAMKFGYDLAPSRDRYRYWCELCYDDKSAPIQEAVIWLIGFGILTGLLALSGYWPDWLRWQIHHGGLRWRLGEASLRWSPLGIRLINWSWGGEWIEATPLLLLARTFFVILLPVILYAPLWSANWAARMEVVFPKMREARTETIAAGNYTGPDGERMRGAGRGQRQDEGEPRERSSLPS